MSAAVALQDAVLSALKADPAVAGYVGDRIYDGAPPDVAYPYISLGAIYFVPESAEDKVLRSENLQIDVWVDKAGRRPAKQIVDAVVDVVEAGGFVLAAPYAMTRCDLILARVEDDGSEALLVHGLVQIEAGVERVT